MDMDRVVAIALAGGFLYYVLLYLTMTFTDGHGCYLHPGLTVSLLTVDLFLQVSVKKELFVAALCIVLQCLGGALGSWAARLCIPDPDDGVELMGIARPNLGTGIGQLWTIELVLALLLALVVLSVRSNEHRRSSLVIGFAYMCIRLLAFPLSFSTLNPARSLAPVLSSRLRNGTGYIFIELTAPVVGCALGAIVFYALNHDTLRSHRNVQTARMPNP
jgi:aquaporin Z